MPKYLFHVTAALKSLHLLGGFWRIGSIRGHDGLPQRTASRRPLIHKMEC